MSRYLSTSAEHVSPVQSASGRRLLRGLVWTAISLTMVAGIATLVARSFIA